MLPSKDSLRFASECLSLATENMREQTIMKYFCSSKLHPISSFTKFQVFVCGSRARNVHIAEAAAAQSEEGWLIRLLVSFVLS
jgi:hypothetical protein